ncbi:hypothetical protein ACI7YT_12670 [Microbacterium sp. M]|uniref:hypothetical protein n=1 Tax=Microbacterium sp. M TaxID=3377125 RepID=UPI003864A104
MTTEREIEIATLRANAESWTTQAASLVQQAGKLEQAAANATLQADELEALPIELPIEEP